MKIGELAESSRLNLKTTLQEQLFYNNPVLLESCHGLDQDQRRVVEGIYSSFIPLIEASLTADQIKSLFGGVEDELTATGKNKTLIGKGIDAAKSGVNYAKQVNNALDQFGRWLQDTTPVKFADQKFEQLRQKVTAKYPKLTSSVDSLGNWLKENPRKGAAVIGIMTVLASLGAGPVGGAIAGQILRGAAELAKGEKLSTALGKSIKTAAYGYIAGWALEGIGNWLEGLRVSAVPYERVPGLTRIDVNATRSLTGPGFRFSETLGSMIVPEERAQEFISLANQARNGNTSAFRELWTFTNTFNTREALANINAAQAEIKAVAIANDQFLKNLTVANDAIVAIAQGTIAGKLSPSDIKLDGKELAATAQTREHKAYSARSLNENQIKALFDYAVKINEGPFDGIVKAIGKGLSKLSTKFTADQLYRDWEKAGAPLNSKDVKQFLLNKGISKQVVDKIWQDAGIAGDEPTAGAQADNDQPADKQSDSDQPFEFDQAEVDAFNAKGNNISRAIFTPGSEVHAALMPNDEFKENLQNFIVDLVGEVKDKYVRMPTAKLQKLANSNALQDVVNRNEIQAALAGHLDLTGSPPEFRTAIANISDVVEEAFDDLFLIWIKLAVKEREATGNQTSTEAFALLYEWARRSLNLTDRIKISQGAKKTARQGNR